MVLSLSNAPVPLSDPIARMPRPGFEGRDPLAGLVTDPWIDFFTRQNQALNASPLRLNQVSASGLAGSIPATDFSGGALNAGLYRITYYARITQAAGVSSSLTVTFSWTDSGQAMAASGAAMTGNSVTTFQSGSVLIRIDGATPVRYSTTYASAGAPVMQYKLDVVLELISA